MKRILFGILALALLCGHAQAATQVEFLLSQVRTSTTSLAGGKVYVYQPGTTSPATLWADKQQTVLANNPYTLDSNGTAQLYGAGTYRFVIYDAAGVKRFDRDNVVVDDTRVDGFTASRTPIGNQIPVLATNGDLVLGSTLAAYPRGTSQNFGYASYVAHAGRSGVGLTANAYLDNGAWKRISLGVAKAIFLDATGEPQFYSAGSGAADSTITSWTANAIRHSGNSPRIIYGVVSGAGEIVSGAGFTVSGGSGSYSINFTTPFSSPPICVPSIRTPAGMGLYAVGNGETTTSCIVSTFNGSGYSAQAFSFMAIGQD